MKIFLVLFFLLNISLEMFTLSDQFDIINEKEHQTIVFSFVILQGVGLVIDVAIIFYFYDTSV